MASKSTRGKYYHVSDYQTLDESHTQIAFKFKKKKLLLPKKKEYLKSLQADYAQLE